MEALPQPLEAVPQLLETFPELLEALPQLLEAFPQLLEAFPQPLEAAPQPGRTVAEGWWSLFQPSRLALPGPAAGRLGGMSPKKPDDSQPERPEVEHVLASLKAAIRVLGFSIRDIEKNLGYSFGNPRRVFGGTIELKVEHVMDIARALEMAPEEILAFIYPTLKDPPSQAAALLWKRLGGFAPTGTFRIRKLREGDEGYVPGDEDGDPVFDPSEEMLERVFRRTLSRVLGQVADALTEDIEIDAEVDPE